MPGMDGAELLRIIKEKYPETIRLILSGYADEQEILYTMQSNLAKNYLFKPWDNDELMRVVRQCMGAAEKNQFQGRLVYGNQNEQPADRG
jgi:response regulator RpfG family c-di-GMP phosphodiesterase